LPCAPLASPCRQPCGSSPTPDPVRPAVNHRKCSAKPFFRNGLCRLINTLQIRTVEDQFNFWNKRVKQKGKSARAPVLVRRSHGMNRIIVGWRTIPTNSVTTRQPLPDNLRHSGLKPTKSVPKN
jgi:hypothetical protein